MSEPLKAQDFERYAWISYDTEENCRNAKEILESSRIQDYKLSPVQSRAPRKSVMITPELPADIIDRDLELCQNLIRDVLDPEKDIP